jgi:SAM-dependent methyltransferase
MSDANQEVQEQYESFPYPQRDPEAEKNWLVTTWPEDLALINHYCYGGRQSFDQRFRVLVAGGGTGDSTIYLAHQLRNTNAEIVYLDFSAASMAIAQQRAGIRGLKNITWIHESLLALPRLNLGTFDHINCSGVLHHLQDPDAGLQALLGSLKEEGAMAILVYGKYGRTGVYQMQSLMRLVNKYEPDPHRKIANTREVLAALPASNWFKRGEQIILDHKKGGDAGVYDVFLHACDRAYSVGELYAWLKDQHKLELQFSTSRGGRFMYCPELILGKQRPEFLKQLGGLSLRQQQEAAELISGTLITHIVFASRKTNTIAPYGDPDFVPTFHYDSTGKDLVPLFTSNPGQPLQIDHAATGIAMTVDPGQYGASVLQHIDGNKSFAEIFQLVRRGAEGRKAAPTDADLFRDFKPVYDFLAVMDRIVLRHRDVPQFENY